MTSAERYNNRMNRIFGQYRADVERQKVENPAWYKHHTTHLMSKRYEGCAYCKPRSVSAPFLEGNNKHDSLHPLR